MAGDTKIQRFWRGTQRYKKDFGGRHKDIKDLAGDTKIEKMIISREISYAWQLLTFGVRLMMSLEVYHSACS